MSDWRYWLWMFPHIVLSEEIDWKPGPYEGVELKVLYKDESSGAVTVLRRFRAGVTVPAHVHREANETAYILSGEWEESGLVYRKGTCFHAPKGEEHGPHKALNEVISLTVFDGPLTVD